jgi:hypothetical protein
MLGLVKARLEVARRGPQGRHGASARGRHGAARIPQERLAGGRVGGGTPGGEERFGLPRAQPVAREGVDQTRLLAARQRRDGDGGGGREAAVIDLRGHVGREPAAEGQPAIHPAPAAAEELDDLGRREVIVVGQRAHHARLIHRAQGAAGRVGFEQAGLGHDAGGVFDHHGHVRVPRARPLGEALEAVEHLVGAGARRRHAERQRGERAGRIGAGSSQRRQRGGEARDRQLDHEAPRGHPRGRVLLRLPGRPHLAPPGSHGA